MLLYIFEVGLVLLQKLFQIIRSPCSMQERVQTSERFPTNDLLLVTATLQTMKVTNREPRIRISNIFTLRRNYFRNSQPEEEIQSWQDRTKGDQTQSDQQE